MFLQGYTTLIKLNAKCVEHAMEIAKFNYDKEIRHFPLLLIIKKSFFGAGSGCVDVRKTKNMVSITPRREKGSFRVGAADNSGR